MARKFVVLKTRLPLLPAARIELKVEWALQIVIWLEVEELDEREFGLKMASGVEEELRVEEENGD